MPYSSVNLAARPFVNTAPLKRLAVVLWATALALTAVTASLYWSYFAGSGGEARAEIEATAAEIAALEQELAEIERDLAGVDLVAMNAEVAFVNERIARRTFGWSRLFEHLAEVLPPNVRFERLSPTVSLDTASGTRRVVLRIDGRARRDEALLNLIDNFFRHPRFRDPDPDSEVRRDGELRFSLEVVYLPPPPESDSSRKERGGSG